MLTCKRMLSTRGALSFLSLWLIDLAVDPTRAACLPPVSWPPSLDESFETAASIFTGTVTGFESYNDESVQGPCVNVTFRVLDVWKGSLKETESTTISTASSSAACGGFEFQQSATYLVWTSSSSSSCGNNELVSLSSPTSPIDTPQAQSDLTLLVEKRLRDVGSCSFTQRCCVDDCCGVGTSWDTFTNRCVSNPDSQGWTPGYEFSGDDQLCLPEYPCCEEECCGAGTFYDSSIAYCIMSVTTPSPSSSATSTAPLEASDKPTAPPSLAPTVAIVVSESPTDSPVVPIAPTESPAAPPQTCTSASDCLECLSIPRCSWMGGSCGFQNCHFVADIECYSLDFGPGTTPIEVCAAEQKAKDEAALCGGKQSCSDCVATVLSDGSSRCKWNEMRSVCISQCGLFGCGSTTCQGV